MTPTATRKLSPYGDADADGLVGLSDTNMVLAAFGEGIGDTGYKVEADINGDGSINLQDLNAVNGNSGDSISRGRLSGSGNIVGYAGYIFEPATGMYVVRHRWYSTENGRWLSEDPLGYIDGSNHYLYGRSSPGRLIDSSGLACQDIGAPGFEYDGSCPKNPFDICKNDYHVVRALERYAVSCRNTSRRKSVTITCAEMNQIQGKADCVNSVITLNPRIMDFLEDFNMGCSTFAHEILHMADFCQLNDDCNLWKNNRRAECLFGMRQEARAFAMTTCCDGLIKNRRGIDWRSCMLLARADYTDMFLAGRCGFVPRRDLEDAWDREVHGLTEDSACWNGSIPPMEDMHLL